MLADTATTPNAPDSRLGVKVSQPLANVRAGTQDWSDSVNLSKIMTIPSTAEAMGKLRRQLQRELEAEEACRTARELLLDANTHGELSLSAAYTRVHALLRAETHHQQVADGLAKAMELLTAQRAS